MLLVGGQWHSPSQLEVLGGLSLVTACYNHSRVIWLFYLVQVRTLHCYVSTACVLQLRDGCVAVYVCVLVGGQQQRTLGSLKD